MKDLSAPDATHFVTFGPMKDGRKLKIDVVYQNDKDKPSFPIVFQEIGNDHYRVEFPRSRGVQGFFVLDGLLACFKEKELCSKMQEYLEAINKQTNPSRIPFIDDLYPEYQSKLAEFRKSEVWVASIVDGVGMLTGMCTLHEIGHIAFRHEFGSAKLPDDLIKKQEAEADGFALTAFDLAHKDISAALALLMPSLAVQETLGYFSFTHPSPSCRITGYLVNIREFISINGNAKKESASNFFQISSIDELLKSFSKSNSCCKDYIDNMKRGKLKALELIDTQTEIHTSH